MLRIDYFAADLEIWKVICVSCLGPGGGLGLALGTRDCARAFLHLIWFDWSEMLLDVYLVIEHCCVDWRSIGLPLSLGLGMRHWVLGLGHSVTKALLVKSKCCSLVVATILGSLVKIMLTHATWRSPINWVLSTLSTTLILIHGHEIRWIIVSKRYRLVQLFHRLLILLCFHFILVMLIIDILNRWLAVVHITFSPREIRILLIQTVERGLLFMVLRCHKVYLGGLRK